MFEKGSPSPSNDKTQSSFRERWPTDAKQLAHSALPHLRLYDPHLWTPLACNFRWGTSPGLASAALAPGFALIAAVAAAAAAAAAVAAASAG